VTYYETTGWRGVMEREVGSPSPQAFPSLPGDIFPLYHVLADVGEFRGGQAAALEAMDGLKVSGLALRTSDRERILLANHTADPVVVVMQAQMGECTARFLDETTVESARLSPDIFRRTLVKVHHSGTSPHEIQLRPFGFACLDFKSVGK
jgi:hypothetical protein